MKKPVLKLALVTAISFGAFGSHPAFAEPVNPVKASQSIPAFDHKIIQQVNSENIYRMIEHLSKEPRVAGTETEDKAVEYIKKQFESYGYQPEIQEFTFTGYKPPSSIRLSVDGSDKEWHPETFTFSVSGKVTGELVDAGKGKKEDFQNINANGKIALIQRGEISFAEKIVHAAEHGAAGVIIYNSEDGALNGTLGEANDRYVPAVSLTKEEGEELAAKLQAGQAVTVSLEITGAKVEENVSHNVIASKKPTNKRKATNHIIVVGAHHDSVEKAPGANDDASGTAMTLELARVLKDMPTDTEIRFVTFGAEEVGLLGSRHYVANLPEDELSRVTANFNLDMVGSRDAGDLVMMTLDGTSNLVTDLAQAASLRLNGEPTPYAQGGRSDHVPFAEAGIPAALFIHEPLEPWYHTPEDTIDKISKEKLQDVAEIVGSAVYDAARFDHKGTKLNKGKKAKAPHLYHKQNIK
ncbi:M28 family peptidase [Bacillus xiapuensis]|uniref:M28 family peptidase n=1 Tax=Bacillus xiapuensis TaxID=2014075 RepID=UPI000C24C037|nr:M28 family peptidase [Bacillus xiapuensis]